MKRIQILKNINNADVSQVPSDAIVVYHSMYSKPQFNFKMFEFEEYKKIYGNIETSFIILVGLNRMINPANRCDFIHEYLTTLTTNIEKMSIDNSPFIGEPWRLFFHYQYSQRNKFNASYSYPLEGEWLRWFYRETNDCCFSSDNLPLYINDTFSDLKQLKTKFIFVEQTEKQISNYEERKKVIFEKYDTPKLIINNLLKLNNDHYHLKIDFNSYLMNKDIYIPDLKIYRFIVEENERRMKIYNRMISNESLS